MPDLRSVTLALVASLVFAVPTFAKPPIWIVRDADSEMVLFGSVHVLKPSLDWQPKALLQALAGAEDVWFELNLGPGTDQDVANLAASRGILPPDISLFSLLSPRDRTRLNRACQRFRMAPGLLDRLEPWYAEVALAGAAFREAGAESGSGVERVLADLAPATASFHAFETAEQQIDMLAGASRSAQLASLQVSLEELERDPRAYDRLVSVWMAADVKSLERDAIAPLVASAPDIYRRLVLNRNTAWTRTLDARLQGRGRTVVVVGVGHLIGKDGVPAQLRALGYSVEGP